MDISTDCLELLRRVCVLSRAEGKCYSPPANEMENVVELVGMGYVIPIIDCFASCKNNKCDETNSSRLVPSEEGLLLCVSQLVDPEFMEPSLLGDNITSLIKTSLKYPFNDLKIGNSFFIADTEKKPIPARSIVGAVYAAHQRYSTFEGLREVNKLNNHNGLIEVTKVPYYKRNRIFRVSTGYYCDIKGAYITRVDL